MLSPGDLVIIDSSKWHRTLVILHVDPVSGTAVDTITSSGHLVDPRALVVLPSGPIVVADHSTGLILVDPATGAQSLLASPAALGGAGPTGVAREATGNLVVVCGDGNGIRRVSPGGALLQTFSAHGLLGAANGIAVGPDGRLWVADGISRIVAVDPVSGAQSPLAVSGIGAGAPLALAIAPSGSTLYVLLGSASVKGFGDGAWSVDTATGVGQWIPTTVQWAQGVGVDPVSGVAWVSSLMLINIDDPYAGLLTRGVGGSWALVGPPLQNFSGVLGVVPSPLATPAIPTTWGRVKAMMR
jgi:hypothetical protein